MKRRSVIRISPPLLVWTCQKKKKKKAHPYHKHFFRVLVGLPDQYCRLFCQDQTPRLRISHSRSITQEFRSAASTLGLDTRYLGLCILLEDDPSAVILKYQLRLNFGEGTFPVVKLLDWSNFGTMIRITE